jgi:putative ABC transport system permease protein
MGGFMQDLKYSARVLLKNPGTTAIMVFTLALGIGATTAIFSVVYGVLLKPLPFSQSNQIMAIWEINTRGTHSHLADPNFDDFRDQNHTFQSMAKFFSFEDSVSGGSQAARTTIAVVTPQFMRVFRAEPFMGRDFSDGDNKEGAAPTAIVSYGFWKGYLGSVSDLSQAHLKIENVQYSVIGVMPPGFDFPQDVTAWVPADLQGENKSRTSHNYAGAGRLKDGVTAEQARQDISAIARRIRATSPEQNDYLLKDADVLPLQDSMTGKARTPLLILLGAVAFLLLVACANVANLMLAQASVRHREMAVRSALGAARGRLIQQFLTEALLLALIGGTCGVLGAIWGVSGLVALAPDSLPRAQDVSVNMPVLMFALLLSIVVAAGLGAFTAIRSTSGDLREGLIEGGRGQAGSYASQRVGRMIVTAQIAITMVLVVGAGLLGRSLMKVLQVDPGFRVDKIIGMDISLPWSADPKLRAEQGMFYSNLIDRLKQIPGVRDVGAISQLPMKGGLPDGMYVLMNSNETPKSFDTISNMWRDKSVTRQADYGVATPDYFRMMGIPLVRGRVFDERDGPNTPHVAVISESLARQVWPNQDPLGRWIEFGNMDGDLHVLTVVGVVKDVRDYGADKSPDFVTPTLYVDLFQRPRPEMTITMLSDADMRSVTGAARSIVQEMNPDVAPKFETLKQVYSASLGSREFNVILFGFFGITALLLAVAGVFGVMAYTVSRRTREIGVRVALGASSANVLGLILGQGMKTILIGIAIGIAGALALTRTLESMLFEVKANDPVTLIAVTLLLIAAALLASYIPARRATKVDPMVALRYE